MSGKFVLVTAAYNEGAYIEETINSIVAQEVKPLRWVIASDGSTDDTDEIVLRYAAEHSFIKLQRLTEDHPRNFAAQANAINAAIEQVEVESYDFVGNLDADITFEPNYFKLLLDRFEQDPKLGLAGGAIHEKDRNGQFQSRRTNRANSVAHAVQMFRRECFRDIGGAYRQLPYGAPDTYAEITARMNGWEVKSFPDLAVYHHRPTSSAGGLLRGWFRQGRMDRSLGVSPVFELFKVANRIPSRPLLIGAMARLAGFIYSTYNREPQAVPPLYVEYSRREQSQKVRSIFKTK